MNNESSPERPSGAAQCREHLDAFLAFVQSRVHEILGEHGQITPTLCVLHEEGLTVYASNSHEDPQDDSHAEDLRLICAAMGAQIAVLVIQVWAPPVQRGKPRSFQASPPLFANYREYLSLTGAALGGFHAHRLLPVLRNRDDSYSCLGTTLMAAAKPVVDRYGDLLPHHPPTAKDRALARRRLAWRGLVIHPGPLPE